MLSEIFSSKTRAAFFRILFAMNSSEFHLREIARQSDLTIGTIQKEAAKLSALDLIIKRVDGNRTYYRANISHQLYKAIREMVLKTSSFLEILQEAFSDGEVEFVFLFGSAVSGNLKAESDIDLFVIGSLSLRQVCGLLKKPTELLGREINPHVITVEEFVKRRKGSEHFLTSVLESPIQMIIGEEYELRKLVKYD